MDGVDGNEDHNVPVMVTTFEEEWDLKREATNQNFEERSQRKEVFTGRYVQRHRHYIVDEEMIRPEQRKQILPAAKYPIPTYCIDYEYHLTVMVSADDSSL